MKTLKGAIAYDDAMAEMYREQPELAAEVLNISLAEGDPEMLLVTLRHMTKAFGGISQIAALAGLNETTLYRTLSRRGNPNLKTLLGITHAMGFHLTLVPNKAEPASRL